jgi:hypothetical protein
MRRTHCNRLPSAPRLAAAYGAIPAFIDTALVAPRAGLAPTSAVRRMADDMRQAAQREGGITEDDLARLGWSAGQIKTHGPDARALAQQLSGASL